MINLPAVITSSLTLSARSWLLVILSLFFRFAAGVAGVFPVVMIVGILLRILISAPVDFNGDPDPLLLGELFFVSHDSRIAISGIFAAVYLIQMVLYSLMDAGLIGEIARAVKEDGKPRVRGFGIAAVSLFPRVMVLRLLASFLGLILSLAFLGLIVFSLNCFGFSDVELGKLLIALLISVSIMVLSMTAFFYSLFMFILMGAGISVSFGEMSIGKSIRESLSYLKTNAVTVAVASAFLLVVFLLYQVFGIMGGIWWVKTLEFSENAEFFATAASAWDISLTLMTQVIWVFAICLQMTLYYRIRLNPMGSK